MRGNAQNRVEDGAGDGVPASAATAGTTPDAARPLTAGEALAWAALLALALVLQWQAVTGTGARRRSARRHHCLLLVARPIAAAVAVDAETERDRL